MNTEQSSNNLTSPLVQTWDYLLAHAPSVLSALLIFLIGIFLAWLVKKLITRSMNALPKSLSSDLIPVKVSREHIERSSRFLGTFIYWVIVLIFLTVATEMLGLAIVTSWMGSVIQYLPNILFAIFSVYLGVFGGRLVGEIVISTSRKAGLLYSQALGKLVEAGIIMVTVLVAINQIGIDVALLTDLISIVLAALLFAAALSFALGSQVSVSNILAAYYLKGLYHEGQQIKIHPHEGKIVEITPTAVLLETAEGQVTIPARVFSEQASILSSKQGATHEE